MPQLGAQGALPSASPVPTSVCGMVSGTARAPVPSLRLGSCLLLKAETAPLRTKHAGSSGR